MLFLLGILPILVLLFLLLGVRFSLVKASAVGWLLALGIAIVVWQTYPFALAVGLTRAVILAIEISLIITGALLFLKVVEQFGFIAQLEDWLSAQSGDSRVQLILLTWFLGGFLEGTAGFGIPAMIVAPLLIRLKFKPLLAICAALFANTTAVVFGAVGTPITVGLAAFPDLIVHKEVAVLAGVVGVWVPTLLMVMMAKFEKRPVRTFVREVLPFSLLAGVSFVVCMVAAAFMFGPELGSVLGAVGGLMLSVGGLRLGWVKPRSEYRTSSHQRVRLAATRHFGFLVPYAVFILLLLAAKAVLTPQIFQVLGQAISFNRANPGLIFLLTAGIIWIASKWLKRPETNTDDGHLGSLHWRVVRVAVSIFFLSGMTQAMIGSGSNTRALPSMLAVGFSQLETAFFPFIAPMIGSLGAFVAGSTTMSTILFSSVQAGVAEAIGFSVVSILALQVVGATAGNLIALSNILAVRSVVRTKISEAEIVKQLAPWFAIYLGLILVACGVLYFL